MSNLEASPRPMQSLRPTLISKSVSGEQSIPLFKIQSSWNKNYIRFPALLHHDFVSCGQGNSSLKQVAKFGKLVIPWQCSIRNLSSYRFTLLDVTSHETLTIIDGHIVRES